VVTPGNPVNGYGFRDLYIACGHIDDNVELRDQTTSYRARNVLLWNRGDGTFENVSDRAGNGMLPCFSSRGAGFDDLDNDGRIDVVILSSRRPAVVLRNESPTRHHWVQVQLRGTKTNRDGVGAQVRVLASGLLQVAEVHSGRGYQSHYGSRLHFGLGPRTHIDRIEVHWIGGGCDVLEHLHADQLVTIVEGTSR